MLRTTATKVYLAPGTTDMRAGINRLSVTVQGEVAQFHAPFFLDG